VALFALALMARHGSLPHDGLIYDDAWVAVGAMKAGPGDLLTVSTNHPGFTALLMGWAGFVTSRAEWMTLPVYVGGAAIAPILYLVLRRLGTARPVTLLVAAGAVVAPAHVHYSGRVKSYVIEAAIILLLAALLPVLARRSWRRSTAALWVAGAVVLGTFSVFTLVAVAAATVILALHPAGDRLRRWAALGVQAVVQTAYLARVQSSFDSSEVATDWERLYDGYIEVTVDPVSTTRQLIAHLARVGDAVVDGGVALTLGITVLALTALAWEAWRGPRRVVARYLLALPTIALVGSVVRQIPFGPTVGNPVFPGTRATLWLLPSLAVGLAFAFDLFVRAARRRVPATALPLSVGLVLVAGVVVAVKVDDAPPYLDSGARSANRFIDERAGDRDVVVVLPMATWSYAALPDVDVRVEPAPRTANGFVPRLVDPRVWVHSGPAAWDGTIAQLRQRLAATPRVFIVNGFVGFGDGVVPEMEAALASLGYRQRPGVEASVFAVSLWERSD
jgi:hypothetical protein